ncbi:MAG: transporter substrate-binding domain-containing protein [Alphaproteobacteria bacterium]|jgi:polar amino acid transport system substrate-binding protein|nr:transporter substrate-binding domain-containing protein [Alphaproteobacteria bacterium]|tara:strand:+ start:41 stop:853 length:813 start_codon:yes stop_codon:yes gene_type:complete
MHHYVHETGMKQIVRRSFALRIMYFGLALGLIAFISNSTVAKAADEASYCFNDWPPYAFMGADGAEGISVEILAEASRRANIIPSFVELPWNRCLELVRSGELDAVIDAAKRDEFIQGPASFSAYTNHFWVRQDDPAAVYNETALKGRTIGLVQGYVYPESLMAVVERAGMAIDYAVDDGNNLRKLAFGRVDVIVADMFGTLHVVRENDLRVRRLLPAHSVDSLYPSFGPRRQALQVRVNAMLEIMLADGFIDKLYFRYFDVGFQDAMPE